MAELFQSTKQNISLHLRNIFNEGELEENRVVKEYLTTAADGKTYRTKFYNLEAIIAVGYRVRSHQGTQFRIWATERLNEYLVKGFTMDDDRPMRDWRQKLDAFLQFNERDILTHPGNVSKAVADQLALEQYDIFHQHRLAEEAHDEALTDDAELKRFLEEDK